MNLKRRLFLKQSAVLGAGLIFGLPAFSATPSRSGTPIHRLIPSSQEKIPVIGMGTWQTFDVRKNTFAVDTRVKILEAFFENGGSVIDSSPMYGNSEEIIGICLNRIKKPVDLFSATKVWTWGKLLGENQMRNSRLLWGVDRIDLMQIHNMLDWETHLETLREKKKNNEIRYIGITTSHGRRHRELERVLERHDDFDFVQFTYNIVDREVESRLLPLAKERNLAVIINRPFQGGNLFNAVENKPLPTWAKEIDCYNWAQFFLKFIISHPAVTCAIPATSQVAHMQENMGAGYGRLPDEATRQRMVKTFQRL